MSSLHCTDVTAEGKVEISTMCKTMNILFFVQGNNATFSGRIVEVGRSYVRK